MTANSSKRGFAARPGDPDSWVQALQTAGAPPKPDAYTARLTVDIAPELRGRIKVTAFRRGLTVADMLRALLAREYPAADDAAGEGAP